MNDDKLKLGLEHVQVMPVVEQKVVLPGGCCSNE